MRCLACLLTAPLFAGWQESWGKIFGEQLGDASVENRDVSMQLNRRKRELAALQRMRGPIEQRRSAWQDLASEDDDDDDDDGSAPSLEGSEDMGEVVAEVTLPVPPPRPSELAAFRLWAVQELRTMLGVSDAHFEVTDIQMSRRADSPCPKTDADPAGEHSSPERSGSPLSPLARLEMDVGDWLDENGSPDIVEALKVDFGAETLLDLLAVIQEREDWMIFIPDDEERWDVLWEALQAESARAEAAQASGESEGEAWRQGRWVSRWEAPFSARGEKLWEEQTRPDEAQAGDDEDQEEEEQDEEGGEEAEEEGGGSERGG